MEDTRVAFLRSMADTASMARRFVQATVGFVTLALSAVSWWKFGIGWGLAVLLGVLLALAIWTGIRLQRELDATRRHDVSFERDVVVEALVTIEGLDWTSTQH